MGFLSGSVTALKGIGARGAAILARLGINNVLELLEHFPREHLDRSVLTEISELGAHMAVRPGREASERTGFFTVKAVLTDRPEVRVKHKTTIITARAHDGTGSLNLTWFNQPFLKNALKPGEYVFSGPVSYFQGAPVMESPEYESARGEVLSGARIVPIYPLTEGISQKMMRKHLKAALDLVSDDVLEEILPPQVIEKYGLMSRYAALSNIHYPESRELFAKARRTLVFTELFNFQLSLLNIRGFLANQPGVVFSDTNADDFFAALPFAFTGAQKKVFDELIIDFGTGNVANRLIQGDVGSGKTAVAMACMFLAAKNGCQSAMMAPTETLAKQHFIGISEFFDRLSIKTALLTSSLSAKQKSAVKQSLAAGETDIIIGTHALIVDNVEFRSLGLVITDEQHRFGVRQRGLLADKNKEAHRLIMTATPIPRTLALILCGDMDISVIDSLPPGRQKVETYSVKSSYRSRIYAFIRKQIQEGGQAFIVCPVIEESETGLKSVKSYADAARRGIGAEVGIMHGKLGQSEKDSVMGAFKSGEIPVLCATTVIEVGIDIPRATVMLIENAERFGLSQLHQLRGRVGRGSAKSYCILITDSSNEVTQSRMKAMTSTADGFKLSELDLKIRGPGDFFGTRQHGLPELKIANLYTDGEILREAQEAVGQLMGNS